MIVTVCFPNDTNEELMWVQHDLYGPVLREWYERASLEYHRAEETIGVKTELGNVLRGIESFDHLKIQYAHDRVAAYFRFLYPGLNTPLFEEEMKKEHLGGLWWDFAMLEFDELCRIPVFIRSFLKAIATENEEIGARFVQFLNSYLDEKYSAMKEDDPVQVMDELDEERGE